MALTRGILSGSVNAIGARTTKTKYQRALEGVTARAAIGDLSSSTVTLPTPVIADGIPSATAMSTVALSVEKAADALRETTIYNTYISVFDTIKSISQSGNFYHELTLSQQQKAELTPLLIKYGYRVELVNNNSKYNVIIRWGSTSPTTTTTASLRGAIGSSGI